MGYELILYGAIALIMWIAVRLSKKKNLSEFHIKFGFVKGFELTCKFRK